MNIYNLGITLSIGFGVIYIIRYPVKYNILICEIVHYSIVCYSRIQIESNKCIKNVRKFGCIEDSIVKIKDLLYNDVELIKNSCVLLTCKASNLIMYNSRYMDFLIYSDIHSYPVNKVICKNTCTFVKKYKVCNYKIYLCQVILSDIKNYLIEFNSEQFNYCVIGNVIDKYVVCYLLRSQHGVIVNEKDICYTMEIMDHNMDIIHVTENDEIVFGPTTYYIKSIFRVRETYPHSHSSLNEKEETKLSENVNFNITKLSIAAAIDG